MEGLFSGKASEDANNHLQIFISVCLLLRIKKNLSRIQKVGAVSIFSEWGKSLFGLRSYPKDQSVHGLSLQLLFLNNSSTLTHTIVEG